MNTILRLWFRLFSPRAFAWTAPRLSVREARRAHVRKLDQAIGRTR